MNDFVKINPKPRSRISCTNCCVEGCPNNYSNTDKSVKFYSFPAKPHEIDKRISWIQSVRRRNDRGDKVWTPKPYSRICSEHFIGNEKSNHPKNPSYIPSVFPAISKLNVRNANKEDVRKKNDRFIKSEAVGSVEHALNLISSSEVATSTDFPTLHDTTPKSREISTQVRLESANDLQFLFECEHQSNTEVSTYCNIPVKHGFKQFVDKNVCPDSGFHGSSSIHTDEQLTSLSGVNFAIFTMILGLIDKRSHGYEKTNFKDRLLIFLMKMKLGISYCALGTLFGVDITTVQRIFSMMLEELMQKSRNFVFWPSKQTVINTMPKAFEINYPNCRVIIDCIEIRIQQSSSAENRIFTYSQCKDTYTAKFLIGITPNGFVSFISDCYGGRASDSFITNDCGLLKLLEAGDVVLSDKGIPGINCDDGVVIVMPPFVHDGHLTQEEVEETYNVASVRIQVERAMQRVKTYGILNNFANELLLNIDDVVFMCCVLTNLQSPIIEVNA